MIASLFAKHWLRLGLAAIVAIAIGWVVLELRAGARAAVQVETLQRELETERAQADLRALVAKAEAERLAQEQTDRLTFGRLQNEAISDPAAADPALGVRNVQRLNQIR